MLGSENGFNPIISEGATESVVTQRLCPANRFRQILEYEHEKNLRSGGIVAVLTVRAAGEEISDSHLFDRLSDGWLHRAVAILEPELRSSDITAVVDDGLKVLLSETSTQDATIASERLREVLQNGLRDQACAMAQESRLELDLQIWDYHDAIRVDSTVFRSTVRSLSENSVVRRNFSPIRFDEESPKVRCGWQVKLKRSMDLVLACSGIIILGPIMLAIALVIKLTSPGPVLFTQNRVGLAGKVFRFHKFRSMVKDADDQVHRDFVTKLIRGQIHDEPHSGAAQPLFKLVDDPRITRVGKVLRRWSLDELPQLFNVLKGDMSLVGPRPAIGYEVENYKPWHLQRLKALPGITGLWQVRGRSQTTFDDMVRFDIHYIRNWSLWLDVTLLLQTVKSVFGRQGAV